MVNNLFLQSTTEAQKHRNTENCVFIWLTQNDFRPGGCREILKSYWDKGAAIATLLVSDVAAVFSIGINFKERKNG